jgi:YopX protein
MSREIKFRGWDGEDERYVYWTLNDLLCRVGEPLEHYGVEDRPSFLFDWEEWTGLKDKDGKDIYEGDIVKMHIHEKDHFVMIVGEVKLKEGCFQVFEPTYEGKPLFHAAYRDGLEVIGSIHENPELIKK